MKNVHYGLGYRLTRSEHCIDLITPCFAEFLNCIGQSRQANNDDPLRLFLDFNDRNYLMLLVLLELGNEVNKFVPEVCFIDLSIFAALPESFFTQLEVIVQRLGRFEVAFDKLFNLKLIFVECVCSCSFPGDI